jgi:hypothetical protein
MPDLGIVEKNDPMTLPEAGKAEKKIRYPDLTLRDANVGKVKGDHECELDEEYTATIRLRVKGMSADEYGERLEFDVLSMDDFAPADGQEYDEGEEVEDEETPAKKKTTKALRYSS